MEKIIEQKEKKISKKMACRKNHRISDWDTTNRGDAVFGGAILVVRIKNWLLK
ncbi:MAG TPA: hypothetical protein VHX86_13930 [Tepidisphaeraceae bacterium]|jgi:hypothetical protein|nr:hypothetical protein [Tepidisphaeraceae bacterium]